MPEESYNKENNKKKANPGSSLTACFSLNSQKCWRLRIEEAPGSWEGNCGCEMGRGWAKQTAANTNSDSQHTAHKQHCKKQFAIVIQTKINKNDSPVRGKGGWQWWEGGVGTPSRSHLLLSQHPEWAAPEWNRGGKIYGTAAASCDLHPCLKFSWLHWEQNLYPKAMQ